MIDFSLPPISLPEAADLRVMEAKYKEEMQEWRQEREGTLAKVVELWDVIQTCETWISAGGGSMAIESYFSARRSMSTHPLATVENAKRMTLVKNASRGYYLPPVCQRIIETGGAEWRIDDADN